MVHHTITAASAFGISCHQKKKTNQPTLHSSVFTLKIFWGPYFKFPSFFVPSFLKSLESFSCIHNHKARSAARAQVTCQDLVMPGKAQTDSSQFQSAQETYTNPAGNTTMPTERYWLLKRVYELSGFMPS